MKKSLLILALSAVVGVANASQIELVNKTNQKISGYVKVVGIGVCADRNMNVTIAPKSTKVIDADNCCANYLEFRTKKGFKGRLGWGLISFCGARERFEISVYAEDLGILEIKNVTGK